jgi:hypothetical protein
MDTTETVFRSAELQLDNALAAASSVLAAQGVAIADESRRTYHYKNQYLLWEVKFSRSWDVGLKTADVSVTLTLPEPAAPGDPLQVEIALRAQLYRSGQASTEDLRSSDAMTVQELLARGIESIVTAKLREGARNVGVAASQFRSQG